MRNRFSFIVLALTVVLAMLGTAVVAQTPPPEAQIGIEHSPQTPRVDEAVRFEAVLLAGEASFFFGPYEGEGVTYEEDLRFEWAFNGSPWDDQQLPGGSSAPVKTGVVVTHAFSTAGTKTVRLRVWNARGEWEEFETTLDVVNDPPVACFDYDPEIPSVGQLVEFDARCSTDPDGADTIESYRWEINGVPVGDGGPVLVHAFPNSGQFPVRLTVTDNGGAWDETPIQFVTVRPGPPVATFSHSPATPSVYDEIVFDPCNSAGDLVAWRWEFGDGTSATGTWQQDCQQNLFSKRYENGGLYDVCLWVTDSSGQVAHNCKVVNVSGPAASFTFSPLNPTTQTPVQFHDQSHDIRGQIISWSWAFGDGGYSSQQHPLHTYAVPGTYQVQLTVTAQGVSGTATHSTTGVIQVRNAPPGAQYVFSPESPKVDEMITFSSQGSSDPDGYIASFEWDFNADGLTDATGSTVTYAFASVGAKLVRLTVTDDRGAQSSVVKVVPVQAEAPLACYRVTPGDPYTGESIGFDAGCSEDSDGTIVLYEWDFTGDGETDATGNSVSHSFASAGVYPVTLKVTDNDGLVGVETKGIPVQAGGTSGDNQPPVGEFTFAPAEDPDVNLHEVVTFQADGSSDPDGEIISYEWDFNQDGVYDATGTEVSHIFHSGGAQIVMLRVTDDEGLHGYKSRVVSVEYIRPDADFVFSPEVPRVGEVVSFDGSLSSDRDGTVEFYEWDFDDDDRADATGQMVNYVFSHGGRIEVKLVVTDNDGVTGIITRFITVEINSTPTAAFDYEPESPKVNEGVTFSSRSADADGVILAYLWEFGDGETSTVQTPSHRYQDEGAYTVTLTVTDNDGKSASASETLRVDQRDGTLNADFSWSPKNPSAGSAVSFKDLSTSPGAAIVSWSWEFGDGSTKATQNPSHTFEQEKAYVVTLTVTDSLGATDSESKTISFLPGELWIIAYPNPVKGRTVQLDISGSQDATGILLRIYSLSQQLVLRKELNDGATGFEWDLVDDSGESVSNGLYFVFVTAEAGETLMSNVFRLLIAQ